MANIKRVVTKDKSITYHNEEYDETYHSVTGAKEEAVKKFAEPCRIAELAKGQDEINILDICFGLGYNTAAAIDAALSANKKCNLLVVGLENDPDIIWEILKVRPMPKFKSYKMVKKAVEQGGTTFGKIGIQLLIDDARKMLKDLTKFNTRFDAVFLDPFSPKKCPELWTEEFFRDIKKVIRPGAIMATYSCARVVRDNLKSAGFTVKDGPCVGRKSPGTIAVKK